MDILSIHFPSSRTPTQQLFFSQNAEGPGQSIEGVGRHLLIKRILLQARVDVGCGSFCTSHSFVFICCHSCQDLLPLFSAFLLTPAEKNVGAGYSTVFNLPWNSEGLVILTTNPSFKKIWHYLVAVAGWHLEGVGSWNSQGMCAIMVITSGENKIQIHQKLCEKCLHLLPLLSVFWLTTTERKCWFWPLNSIKSSWNSEGSGSWWS